MRDSLAHGTGGQGYKSHPGTITHVVHLALECEIQDFVEPHRQNCLGLRGLECACRPFSGEAKVYSAHPIDIWSVMQRL